MSYGFALADNVDEDGLSLDDAACDVSLDDDDADLKARAWLAGADGRPATLRLRLRPHAPLDELRAAYRGGVKICL